MDVATAKGYEAVYEHLGDFDDDGERLLGGGLGGDFLSAAARLTARLENGGNGGVDGVDGVEVSARPNFGDVSSAAAAAAATATEAGNAGRRKLTQASASDVFLELIIVNDKARVTQYGSDAALLHSDAIHVTNIVSTLFKNKFTPNLNIVLVAQYDNTAADPWSVAVDDKGESEPGDLLNKFAEWRSSKYAELPSHDSAHLYSGRDFTGDSVGRANQWGAYNTSVCEERDACGVVVGQQTVGEGQCYTSNNGAERKCCRPLLSAAISQVHRGFLMRDAITVAHEIGHTLGFNHDGMDGVNGRENEGTGDCPVSGYIMAYIFNADDEYDEWSACSNRTYKGNAAANQFACLTTGRTAVCGNGVLEAGETCDCGDADCSVRDPCCVGSTCQLKAGALCSAGEGRGLALPSADVACIRSRLE